MGEVVCVGAAYLWQNLFNLKEATWLNKLLKD